MHDRLVSRRIAALHQCFLVSYVGIIFHPLLYEKSLVRGLKLK